MFNRILLVSAFALVTIQAFAADAGKSLISLDIVCDHAQPMRVEAATANRDFYVGMNVPGYSKAYAVLGIVKFDALQSDLFKAIECNNPALVIEAVTKGANVNKPLNGKSPAARAVELQCFAALQTLLGLGARIN